MRTVVFALFCFIAASTAHAQSATELCERGVVRLDKGDFDKAIADFDQALAINPKCAEAYFARGVAWGKKDEYDKAIADFTEAIRLAPRYAEAHYNRGRMWEKKVDYDHAYADYSEAFRLNPDSFMIRNNLAWLQATCPVEKYRDGKKAVENALVARKLYGSDHWKIAATLAAAYAENSNFGKAREWQEKAIKLAGNDKSATGTDKKNMQSRLEIYTGKKPYHEPAKSRDK